ncbi:unnamed protein product [Adineta steineri]|uniref:Uncharacterized protein n=1 Tax=Adineta steineri TaxID=433720 RepID=A0A819KSC8_9BILA|nr:unnamed protein product [Adineta steineri]CAF3953453.1 unnamed protein product [Adineta steineri]
MSDWKNEDKIRQSTRSRTRSSSFNWKAILLLIIIVVLFLITIGCITMWACYMKKVETPNNTTTTETTNLTTSTDSHTTTMNASKFKKWNQTAITVAGGNVQGHKSNQLSRSEGIFIDKNKNVFIADRWNHRIVEWKYNATEGQIIAGGKQGNEIDQLYWPTDIVIDEQNHSIIIADYRNKRVMQWSNQQPQILIDNIECHGVALDKHGFLYVTDVEKNEVRRWKMGDYNNKGTVVAGAKGKGDKLNQLDFPAFIFVDEDQSVYISDKDNHRVMKWRKDATEGTVVAGGNGEGRKRNQLSYPRAVAVDDLGQIYVADWGNDRVMRWCEGKEEGDIVIGKNNQGNQSKQLYGPTGLSFDAEGNLYVADTLTHQIVKFEIIS